MTDIYGIHAALIERIVAICRDDNVNRESEMQNFIEMINDIHVTAIGALAGAVLISAKLKQARGKKVAEELQIVRDLVEKQDASFSLQLRDNVMNFIVNQGTPNPFDDEAAKKHT